jgi:hypothetical protein
VPGNGNLVLSYPKESEEKRLLDAMVLAMPKQWLDMTDGYCDL